MSVAPFSAATAVIRDDSGIQVAIQPSLIAESASGSGLDGRLIWYITSLGGDSFFEIDYQNVTSTSFPNLEEITGSATLSFSSFPNCTEILFPKLRIIDGGNPALSFQGPFPQLTEAEFPAITHINSEFKLKNAENLVNLSFPSLVSVADSTELDFFGNALSIASVNSILIQMNSAKQGTGDIDLSGGTSAAPTGAGVTAVNALIDAGWNVETN